MKSNNKTSIEELFYEESLVGIKIHQSEQENLDRVFDILYNLENEPSSDEDKVSKQYLKQINQKAEEKRAINFSKTNNKKAINTSISYNSDKNKSAIKPKKDYYEDKSNTDEKILNKKFGQKALRKILRKYLPKNSEIPKEDIKLMIWENDENLDGFLNKIEFDKMYKKCIIDLKEKEPKRLFYLVLFLMFDKEEKRHIIEEDTLEILYIRYKQKFEEWLIDIFGVSENGQLPDSSVPGWPLKKSLNYNEFVDRMNCLSLQKRKSITHMKKDYCDYIHEILKQNGLPVIHVPNNTKNKKKV